MRKLGKRFIEPRIVLRKDVVSKWLPSIKAQHAWTWQQFADYLGVSERTLSYYWRNAVTTIPESVFEKLNQVSNGNHPTVLKILPEYWGQSLGGLRSQPARGVVPVPGNLDFAELYGAMLGDGCVYSTQNSIGITSNAIQDRWYVEHRLASICYDLFNIKPRIYFRRRENAVQLILNSRKIARCFIEQGFPAGKKNKQLLEIPSAFFKNKHLLASCLRGFVDTDGGVHPHPHTKIMLGVTTKSPSLLASLHKAFHSLGVPVGMTRHCLQMYGRQKLTLFFAIIGSSNPRNIIRYEQFLRTGITPTASDTESLLRGQSFQFAVPYYGPVV